MHAQPTSKEKDPCEATTTHPDLRKTTRRWNAWIDRNLLARPVSSLRIEKKDKKEKKDTVEQNPQWALQMEAILLSPIVATRTRSEQVKPVLHNITFMANCVERKKQLESKRTRIRSHT